MSEKDKDDERRGPAGIEFPVPWSGHPVRIRGLGAIAGLQMVATGLLCYVIWQQQISFEKMVVIFQAQLQEQKEMNCLLIADPSAREARAPFCKWKAGG